jgi:hypothetical protein
MLLTMLKSFPWYRDTYMQGSVREVDEKTGKQFVAAGLAKAAPDGAKVTPSTTKAQPLRNMAQRLKKVITQAPVKKGEAGSHVVGAMTQPQQPAGAAPPAPAAAAHSHVVGAMTQPQHSQGTHAPSAEAAKTAKPAAGAAPAKK